MKIVICGSIEFTSEIKEVADQRRLTIPIQIIL